MRNTRACECLVIAMLAGCSTDYESEPTPASSEQVESTQTALSCAESTQVIDLDARTELGFTPRQIVDLSMGMRTRQLRWTRGGSTELRTHFSATTEPPVFVKSTTPQGSTINCTSRVEVTVQLEFVTADGAFNEKLRVVLKAAAANGAFGTATIARSNLSGSFDMSAVAGELQVDLMIDRDGVKGSLADVLASRDANQAPSLRRAPIAEW